MTDCQLGFARRKNAVFLIKVGEKSSVIQWKVYKKGTSRLKMVYFAG